MQNAGLDESQDGIKFAGRKINNLRYADDTTLMAESEEELKRLFMRVMGGEWKAWLKTQHAGFPRGPGVKNLPCNAGDTGLIPGWGPKIPHALEQLESPCISMKGFT